MDNYEIITRYRWLMEEAWALKKQADRVLKIGTPAGIASQAITGMPRGTNDPEAAAIQAYDGYAKQLREKAEELLQICGRFEQVLNLLKDDRQRTICRMYYALCMTEEKIAEKTGVDQSTVNRDRTAAINFLRA